MGLSGLGQLETSLVVAKRYYTEYTKKSKEDKDKSKGYFYEIISPIGLKER
jgi:hypothetical protein